MSMQKVCGMAFVGAMGVVAFVGAVAIGAPANEVAVVGKPELQLPPGMTEEDMQACIRAATPGENQAFLAKGAGKWRNKSTMWMAPGAAPMVSEGTSTVTPIMDGRYTKVEFEGEMPGMGPYHGIGIYGFDNVSQKFVASWLDNHSTGIMQGEGELSSDGKTLTWEFTGNCPITKKPIVMREVETITGPNTKTLEMFGTGPKGTKEFRMMLIEMTRN